MTIWNKPLFEKRLVNLLSFRNRNIPAAHAISAYK